MRSNYSFLIVFLIVVSFFSCVKPFVPDLENYEDLLVVDGGITNGPGPYTIKLSRSLHVQKSPYVIPYVKCIVEIADDAGNKVSLTEKQPGVYQTDSLAIRGMEGRKYKLMITGPDGTIYESDEEEMPKGLNIQSVYGELEHKDVSGSFYGRDGLQFYVDAETATDPAHFLLWRAECTYKFKTDLPIDYYYDKDGLKPVFHRDTFSVCYKTVTIPDFYLLNNKDHPSQEIKRQALNYEDNYSKALFMRYSLKVSQYVINETAYNFWREIKKMRDAGGDIFTTQPFQIKNNLRNISNPDVPVLGYFMVSGYSEKRIFVNRPPIIPRYDVCTIPFPPPPGDVLDLARKSPELWPVFLVMTTKLQWLDAECMDCRVQGVQQKPGFWVE